MCVCVCVLLLQRVAAVLARKKLEEDMKAKKLQQIEEDRKMAEELFKQRQEREVCSCTLCVCSALLFLLCVCQSVCFFLLYIVFVTLLLYCESVTRSLCVCLIMY